MREFVGALRAIWGCWQHGTKLDFRGEYYQHTLMTDFFNPGPSEFGLPRVFLAAVGEMMTEVAGEVADGVLLHPFTTERYLREVTLRAVDRGLATSGRKRSEVQLSYPGFIVTGTSDEEMAAAATGIRRQIAFYGSTPAYRAVLDLHGWGDLQGELNTLSKRGEWVKMGDLIDDEMLHAFAVVAAPEAVPGKLLERFGDVVDRVSLSMPYASDNQRWRPIVAGLKKA
jgi:probable F420-dependent oxidoreductase